MAEQEIQHATVFDTDRQYLGDIYAKSLLAVSQESGNMDQVLEELDSFASAISKLDNVRQTLESPRVPTPHKVELIDKIANSAGCSDVFKRFLKVVVEKERFDCLSAIRHSAQRMHNEMSGKLEANVVTAEAIDDGLKSKIASQLSSHFGKDVMVTASVDPSIIGGMVVRVGDTVFDSSVANELSRVRHRAIDRAGQEIRKSLDRFAQE